MATRVLGIIKENKQLIGFRIICSLKDRRGIHILNLHDAKLFYKTVERFENIKYIGKGQWEGIECSLDRFPVYDKAGNLLQKSGLYFLLGKMLSSKDDLVSYKLMDLNGDVYYPDVKRTISLGQIDGFINAKLVTNGDDYIISSLKGNLPVYHEQKKDNKQLSLDDILKDTQVKDNKGVIKMDSNTKKLKYILLGNLFAQKQEGKATDKDIAQEVGATSGKDMSLKIHEYLDEPMTKSDSEILKDLFKAYKESINEKNGVFIGKQVSGKDVSLKTIDIHSSSVPNVLSIATSGGGMSFNTALNTNKDMARMYELVDELKKASIAYYSNDEEIMSNYEYDKKSDELDALEKKTGVVLPDSILHVVAFDVKSKLVKVRHPSKMLSLDKTKDRVELGNSLGGQPGFLGWKLDGLTIVVTYENGELQSAVTRGDGAIGEDVLHNVKVSTGIPLKISYKDKLVVRGEALISYKTFETINSKITNIDDKYKNPRNLASGSIRQLDSKIAAKRGVHIVAFTVVEGFDNLPNYTDKLEEIRKLGFDVVPYVKVTKDNTVAAIEHFEKLVTKYEYPTDGLVISIDDIAYGEMLGTTSKFPRNSKAFKWKDDTSDSPAEDIDWSVGRTGAITPVAVFKPVDIEGSTVSRASLHNVSIFRQLKIGKGDILSIFKANMIIPQIAENKTQSNTFEVPTKCPVCGSPTRIEKTQATKAQVLLNIPDTEVLMCDNPNCVAKHIGGLVHFVERDALNIDGLSEATLERFVNEGYIHDFKDIYHLSDYENKIIKLDGFGKASYSKLYKAIEKSRECELPAFLYGLGVAQMGRTTSKDICKALDYDLEKIMSMDANELQGIDGVGEKTAKEIFNYFDKNKDSVRELAKEFTFKAMPKVNRNSPISGMTFCITGDVYTFKNRKELQVKIESLGGKASSSVSAKTNYLINNDITSNSNKNQTAKSLNVPIISEADFLKLIGE